MEKKKLDGSHCLRDCKCQNSLSINSTMSLGSLRSEYLKRAVYFIAAEIS